MLTDNLEFRLAILFLAGALAGSFVNWAAFSWSSQPRPISPWSRSPRSGPKRHWWDRIPIVGWLGLRREERLHGKGFWRRPLLVELAMAIIFAWLYYFEAGWWGQPGLHGHGILPLNRAWLPAEFTPAASTALAIHMEVLAHLILITLMLPASLIDIDEKTIPDEITVPGALLGLALAAIYPWSLLPADVTVAQVPRIDFLRLTSPNPWPDSLEGFPRPGSLAIGLACYGIWCVGLLHRPWRSRHGYRRAMGLLLARVRRDPFSKIVLRLGVIGAVAIAFAWYLGGTSWHGLLSSLVGLAVGGGTIWCVRWIGSAALQKEAMGFGDVTLMSMIGAFVGWQPSLVVFFLAPFAALVIGGIQFLARRDPEIYYGPYLSMATVVVIVRWPDVWARIEPVFSIPWLVPAVMAACFLLMAAMLSFMRLIRR